MNATIAYLAALHQLENAMDELQELLNGVVARTANYESARSELRRALEALRAAVEAALSQV